MMRFPSMTLIVCIATLTGPATAETYRLSPENTAVSFTTNRGLFRPQGMFGHVSGNLAFTPDRAAESQVDVTLDMASLRIGGAVFSKRLLGPDCSTWRGRI